MIARLLAVGLLLLLVSGCATSAKFGDAEYYWRKPEVVSQTKARDDVRYCMDEGDAAFERSGFRGGYENDGSLLGLALALGVHAGAANTAVGQAMSVFDRCMLNLGYAPWTLTEGQRERVTSIRGNTVRTEILSKLMSAPAEPGSVEIPIVETRIATPSEQGNNK